MAKTKDTVLDFGFVQVPVAVYTAIESDDRLKTETLCHGRKPKMEIRCIEGGEVYSAWNGRNAPPQKGYELPDGEFIVLEREEIEAAQAGVEAVDTIKVEKSVDVLKVCQRYGYAKTYRIGPAEGGSEQTRRNFQAILEVVRESKAAVLVRYAPSSRVHRYAVLPAEDGTDTLLAHEIRPLKPVVVVTHAVAADAKTKTQAAQLLASVHAEDVVLPQEPDPIFELVQKKLAARGIGTLKGIGQEQAAVVMSGP